MMKKDIKSIQSVLESKLKEAAESIESRVRSAETKVRWAMANKESSNYAVIMNSARDLIREAADMRKYLKTNYGKECKIEIGKKTYNELLEFNGLYPSRIYQSQKKSSFGSFIESLTLPKIAVSALASIMIITTLAYGFAKKAKFIDPKKPAKTVTVQSNKSAATLKPSAYSNSTSIKSDYLDEQQYDNSSSQSNMDSSASLLSEPITGDADKLQTNAVKPSSLENMITPDQSATSNTSPTKSSYGDGLQTQSVDQAAQKDYEQYSVKKGDCLWTIAKNQYKDFSNEDICLYIDALFSPQNGKGKMNEFTYGEGKWGDSAKNPHFVFVGQNIKVPVLNKVAPENVPEQLKRFLSSGVNPGENTNYYSAKDINGNMVVFNFEAGKAISAEGYGL